MLETLIISSIGSALTFLATWYWTNRSGKVKTAEALLKANHDLADRTAELETQMRIMSQSVGPISMAMQKLLTDKLTHLHTPVTDRLLVKLGPPSVLTEEEETILFAAVKERITDMGPEITDEERDAASIFPIIVKMAKAEAALLAKASGQNDKKG